MKQVIALWVMLVLILGFFAVQVFASETTVTTKASDTEVTLTTTTIQEQKVSLKMLKQQKAQFEARKAQIIIQLDSQIAKLDKAIKDAEAQGVVETKPTQPTE